MLGSFKTFCTTLVLFFVTRGLMAFQGGPIADKDTLPAEFEHNARGFEFTSADRKFQLQFSGRLQFRFATPNDQNPLTYDDYDTEKRNIFKINRARLKVGGYAYQPWLKYYFEYELGSSDLLDFRVMVEKWPWLSFKAGQWKSEYSRERIISSGNQQMMERSIINRPFTLDRQQGVSVYGRLNGPGLADFNYNLMVLTGNGRGTSENDDKHLLYSGRVQWNFLGEGVGMSGSALDYYEKPNASLALVGATNTSQYTRFSTQGGGSLTGFEEGVPGQYTMDQWLIETALKYRNLSWHSEIHQKNIHDNVNLTNTKMVGWFGQWGVLLNPQNRAEGDPLLEIAGRYAHLRPNFSLPKTSEDEYTIALNCFFNQHLNKLTADVTLFNFDDRSINREASGWRFRVQYDFSF